MTVLTEFIKLDNYNGQIRQLLKFWLEALRPVLYHLTKSSDQTFYLTSLESKLSKRIQKDAYDLKLMA
jgi:hypothetical protein